MIIELLIELFTGFLDFVIGFRPEWEITLPDIIKQGFLWIRQMDAWMPATETMICLGIFLGGFGALFVWKWLLKIIDWVADIIP